MKTESDRRPNLIFVLADQLGYSRCGYAGDEKTRTPNIDSLASQGVNFCNVVSNTPVCAAYRASLFTGKYTTSTGMVINELKMRTDHECFGHVLTKSGYQTCYTENGIYMLISWGIMKIQRTALCLQVPIDWDSMGIGQAIISIWKRALGGFSEDL